MYEVLSKHNYDLNKAIEDLKLREKEVDVDYEKFKNQNIPDNNKPAPNVSIIKRKMDLHNYSKVKCTLLTILNDRLQ